MSDNNPVQKLHPRTAYTFTEDRLEALKAVVPEAFADGKIDWDALQEALGEHIVSDEIEYFGLSWAGKRQARRVATTPSRGTLIPDDEASINPDTTRNIFIEADNLEALKLLQKSYAGRVKMIYIDPPYNTGNDFVYRDDFKESEEDYLERANALSDTGKRRTTNTKTKGRFHANWLNMMYPRLRLARTLLRDDGVIFVSIDDNEVHHLRMLMDEVFGAENFSAIFIWQKRKGGGNDSNLVAYDHDYIVMFAKDKSVLGKIFEGYDEDYAKRYREQDDKGFYFWDTFRRKAGKQYYKIVCPDGTILEKDEMGNPISWLRSPKTFLSNLESGEVKFVQVNGKWSVHFKQRKPAGKKPRSILNNVGLNRDGSNEILEMFGVNLFDTPKPSALIKYFMEIATTPYDECIILDFFAGSGTTAQAVLEANLTAEDNNWQFILVQINEPINEESDEGKIALQAGYDTISQITIDRIKKVIGKINAERAGRLLQDGDNQPDLGFRVFRYAYSHYAPWWSVPDKIE